MATKKLTLKGTVAWARVQENNFDDYRGAKNWKICVFPDKETIKKYKDAGGQARLKYDDGEKSGIEGQFYQFKRPVEKDFGKGKGVEAITPVKLTFQGKAFEDAVGNGSVCEIELELYDTQNFGKGTRLVSVNVLDLIEYERPDTDSDDDDNPPFDVDEPKKVEDIEIGSPEEGKKGRKVDW